MPQAKDATATRVSPREWPDKLLRPRHLALRLAPPKPQREPLPDLDTLCDLCLDGRPHQHLA
jgi:hypothetical protein